jgi:hypothetical protein
MKAQIAFAVASAALVASTVQAIQRPRDEIEYPRGYDYQAPRGQEIQAPRGQSPGF